MTAADLITQRERIFTDLYLKAFPAVASYIHKMGGSFNDAKDIFQDALVIYYEKIITENIHLKDDKAYLFGIVKHLWSRKFREHTKIVHADDTDFLFSEIEDFHEDEISSSRVMNLLSTAGKKCMELLKAFYYDKLNMQEISNAFGFSSTRSATVQKYKCLEKVKDTVKEKALNYESFVE